jgi:hypothetical protein
MMRSASFAISCRMSNHELIIAFASGVLVVTTVAAAASRLAVFSTLLRANSRRHKDKRMLNTFATVSTGT